MCKYCQDKSYITNRYCGNSEEAKDARHDAYNFSLTLKLLSYLYADISSGHIKPHTEEMKKVGKESEIVIKKLVEEWL